MAGLKFHRGSKKIGEGKTPALDKFVEHRDRKAEAVVEQE